MSAITSMTINRINLGTRVDMRVLQQVNRGSGKENEGTYVSSVFAIEDEDTLLIDMPMRGGRIVLVPIGLRYELVFTMPSGLWKAEAEVTGRVKKKGFMLLYAQLISPIVKFQRREYYRLNVMMPLSFITLNEEAGELKSMADIRSILNDDGEIPLMKGEGTIVNISGGGMRFVTEQNLTGIHYLFLKFVIENGGISRDVALIGEIVGEYPIEAEDSASYRIRLLYKDSHCQELIIRFIFEQERKIRRKELGE